MVSGRTTESFTAKQPDKFLHDTTQATDVSDEGCVAAVDIGANDFVPLLYQRECHACPLFDYFHHYTERVNELQSQPSDQADSSRLIETLSDKRTAHRNHAQDALVRHLARFFS